ncbi:MAG TPA: 4Fe-4S dicluster domain-containing protein [Dehalococcoidia bacterium]|nr:4Fe-4S dicluster domain-containing protein [Dehalococcoidia bacterium]
MTQQGGAAPVQADMDRRAFLKTTGGAVASVALVGLGLVGALKGVAFPSIANASGVIMPDPSLCIGCLTCEVQCSEVHKQAGLSDVPRIRIYHRDTVQVDPQIVANFGDRGRFFQHVCLQCPDAPCVPVCPVNALHVDGKTGARVIDPKTCIACGKCEQACIFPTPPESQAVSSEHYHQTSRITRDTKLNVFAKCDLCNFRPEGPACIERCPVNVRIKQGIIKSDVMCLDLLKPENKSNFEKMRAQQTAPA